MKEVWIGLKCQGLSKHWCITGLKGSTRERGGFVLRPLGGSVDSCSLQEKLIEASFEVSVTVLAFVNFALDQRA
jgi:hypothetical protein